MNESELTETIFSGIRNYFSIKKFNSRYRIPLAVSTIGADDIVEAIDSFLSMQLTMGPKTLAFENAWAQYVGTKGAVLTNSGTTAEMIAIYTLANPEVGSRRLAPGHEVITSAVTFPSSVNSIVNVSAIPVFVDVNLETLNMDSDQIEAAISKRTKCILPVHFMGNPCDMKPVMDVAHRGGYFVVEDVAESHGAMVDGKKAGSFGDMGIFSFFFSHHISTIEGGALVSNSDLYLEISKSLRSYGWIRTLSQARRETIARNNKKIDPRHLYVNVGYNFKPTEINAALGLHQIERIEQIIEAKRRNANYLTRRLRQIHSFEDYMILPHERRGTRHSWLGYPVVVREGVGFDKFYVMNFLEKNSIETRQLEAGNVTEQPSVNQYRFRKIGSLRNSKVVMNGGLFFGNYHTMSSEDLNYVVNVFEKLLRDIRTKFPLR